LGLVEVGEAAMLGDGALVGARLFDGSAGLNGEAEGEAVKPAAGADEHEASTVARTVALSNPDHLDTIDILFLPALEMRQIVAGWN
jgi:hypothetical protein